MNQSVTRAASVIPQSSQFRRCSCHSQFHIHTYQILNHQPIILLITLEGAFHTFGANGVPDSASLSMLKARKVGHGLAVHCF